MSDDTTAPLILAAVSLAATLLTTLVGAYITYYSDEHKARREANRILLKYRDPLLFAAMDLQARCYGLCDMNLLEFKDKDEPGDDTFKDTLYIYTAYVIGQYLSWTWILRRQAQFVALASSAAPRWQPLARRRGGAADTVTDRIDKVTAAFNASTSNLEKPFILFKAHQQSIGEIMSSQDVNGDYYCMGYATFTQRWKNGDPEKVIAGEQHAKSATTDTTKAMAGVTTITDQVFRAYFKSIEQSINTMYDYRMKYKARCPNRSISKSEANQGSDARLRRLQHLLIDLIHHLDDGNVLRNMKESKLAAPAHDCECSLAPCHCELGCKVCIRNLGYFGSKQKDTDCACKTCVGDAHHYGPVRAHTFHKLPDAVAGAASHSSSHEKHIANSHEKHSAHV